MVFRNDVLFRTPDPTGGARLVYDVGSPLDSTTGVKLVGSQYVAELYAGNDVNSLQPVTTALAHFRSSTTTRPGAWTDPVTDPVISGAPQGTVLTLQVRVWDANQFASYEQALGHGITGASIAFQYTVPAANDPINSDFYMEGLRAFALVPEPSAIALGVLGVVGLLATRRNKRGS